MFQGFDFSKPVPKRMKNEAIAKTKLTWRKIYKWIYDNRPWLTRSKRTENGFKPKGFEG